MGVELWLLAPAAFLAGMVDAVVGGGGLIQIPALLGVYPQAPMATLFGTNKLSSIVGTTSALWRYARSVRLPWRLVGPATLAALPGAWGGAALVAWLPREAMRPLVIVLLVAVLLYTYCRKQLGVAGEARLPQPGDTWRAALFGLVLGAYDGFFGPGTGSFLMFGFVRLFGMDFLHASASTKLVNAATNFSALLFFASQGALMQEIGLAMAVCNLAGAQLGAQLAVRCGPLFIRRIFLLVVTVLIAHQLAISVA